MVNNSRKQNQSLRRNVETIINQSGTETSKNGDVRDIAEQNSTLRFWRESEEGFSQLFHSSTAAFAITRIPDEVFIDINEAYQQLTGFSREELIGHAATELNIWVDIKQRELMINRLKTEGRVRDAEIDIRYKDGKPGKLIFSIEIIHLYGENFALSTAIDITERKKTEALLRESEEKYRNLFLNMAEEVSFWKLERYPNGQIKTWRLVDANPPALKGFGGQPLKEIKGKTTDEIFGPGSTANHIHKIEKIMTEGIPYSYEDYFPNMGKYLRLTTVPLGEYFITTGTDITRIKQAKDELENKIRERTLELRESEEQYRKLVDNANEGVLVIQDGIIKFTNKKGSEINGYSMEELGDKPFWEFIHPDDRQSILETYQGFMRGEDVQLNYEFRIIRKDGSIRWLQMNVASTTWSKRPAILAIFTDITERKNMDQALQNFSQRLIEVQEEERKRIAYELHDDTAQYLGIIKMQIGALISSGKIRNADILDKLKYLERDANQAYNDVRRYSHELRPVILERTGLTAALEQVTEDYNKLGQLSVEMKVGGSEPELTEEVKLTFFRIAQEALNNSRKHSKARGASITLNFRETNMEMVVSDNGIGFNVEEATAQTNGKGSLGLMSMRERADLIKADLEIESEEGKGTRVILRARQG